MTGALYLLLETDADMDMVNAACKAHNVQIYWMDAYEVTPGQVRLFGERLNIARLVGACIPMEDRVAVLATVYNAQPHRESKRSKGG